MKLKTKYKHKKNAILSSYRNDDTLSRITQELPRYNWLEEKIRNGGSSASSACNSSNASASGTPPM